jgi:uncharacterized protein GlcG (DUF336 family)
MTLTLAHARRLTDAAHAEAERLGLALAIAVVDASGHAVCVERMDGAGFLTPDIALGKAYTAAAFRVPSRVMAGRASQVPVFATAMSVVSHGRYTPQPGGVPIEAEGEVVGAMGASGATADEDEAVLLHALGQG